MKAAGKTPECGFQVTVQKKYIILFLCLVVGMDAVLIAADARPFAWVMAGVLLVVSVAAVLAGQMFRVNVAGNTFYVRTRLGRRYQFDCSDIEQVTCLENNSLKHGPSFYLTLSAKSRDLNLEATMDGFSKMAGFILEKYENGEILPSAVSEDCKRELVRYKNGEIYPKKRRRPYGRENDQP